MTMMMVRVWSGCILYNSDLLREITDWRLPFLELLGFHGAWSKKRREETQCHIDLRLDTFENAKMGSGIGMAWHGIFIAGILDWNGLAKLICGR